MPIFRQTYRTYEGRSRSWFRWWTVAIHELRIIFQSWAFRGLFIIGLLHIFFRGLQVLAFDLVNSRPDTPIALTLQGMRMLTVNPRMFFDFIRIQSSIVFVTAILAGAGMIANDFRNNLMEVYFSKPITWRDYVAGKIVALSLTGLLLTAVPAILLVIMHNLLIPSWDTFHETYWWVSASILFSLAVVLPCSLGVLASSALFKSQRFAGIAVFMVLFGNSSIGATLAALMNETNYLIIAFPMSINHLGQHLFHDRKLEFNLDWRWAYLYVTIVCLLCLWLLCRKVRRAEAA